MAAWPVLSLKPSCSFFNSHHCTFTVSLTMAYNCIPPHDSLILVVVHCCFILKIHITAKSQQMSAFGPGPLGHTYNETGISQAPYIPQWGKDSPNWPSNLSIYKELPWVVPVFLSCPLNHVRKCLCKVQSLNIVTSNRRDDIGISLFLRDKVYWFRSRITN